MSILSRTRPRTLVLVLVPLAAVILIGTKYFSAPVTPAAPAAPTEPTVIADTITAVGTVVPKEHADLGFTRAGTIISLPFDVGANVSAGQLLASLDADDAEASLATAKNELLSARAELAKSDVILDNAQRSGESTISEAYANAEDAVNQQLDAFFSDDDRNPQLTFNTHDGQVANDMYTKRLAATDILADWHTRLSSISLAETKLNIVAIRALLYRAQDALRAATSLDAETIKLYKTAIATGLAESNGSMNGITSIEQDIRAHEADRAVQAANILRAESAIDQAKVALRESNIYAPFSGIVTAQDLKRGEFAPTGKPVISLASRNSFEIETDVPEAYIGKMKAGKAVTITLDAYPDVTLKGTIASIEPAGRSINDVVYYRVKVSVIPSTILKNGLTANVTITP